MTSVIEATSKHMATILFLHGLGDTGHAWADELARLRPSFAKVICPTAPSIPVTINGGEVMHAWFDIKALNARGSQDKSGISIAANKIHRMIEDEESHGIPSEHIVLGGFSQGGALALYSGLTYPKSLAGIISLSGWLPLHDEFPGAAIGNTDTPILQCHGDSDEIVQLKWGETSAALLKMFASNVDFRVYTGLSHSSSDEEMEDVKEFIKGVLPSQ